MTDEQIIRFVEHAMYSAKGEDGFKEIHWEHFKNILDLINRQKAEIDRLQEHNDQLISKIDDLVYKCDCAKQELVEKIKKEAAITHTSRSGNRWYEFDDKFLDSFLKEMISETLEDDAEAELQRLF